MTETRERLGVSRAELVRASGVPLSTLTAYENRVAAPGIYNLVRLADALGVGLDEYIGHTPKKRREQ